MTYQQIILIIYVAYLVFMSLVTFFLFLKDKGMAKKNNSEVRIKEKTLLSSVVFGGAVGGFIGRIVAHHKTNKGYFSFTIYISLLLQACVLVLFILLAFGVLK
ncbi:uncharacterized membrane protein YsdA (DUF1294 family) [Anaeroplasma bactoclasticum]|uniref:Uncharacterized membrane protein YsdA (DUF1294 family) n=1 Tax=Anaeroplasma bactoclasticum TaxID=2088 RepID=A0A397QVB8_9MOLU|nr:DUF1294 domain-containing protein [Anaeroplasma bactoclasticum]RIA64846.1 uncharacterized membrane protein YsdA (DUF1294 family) [Anaeroplasma bactoclasticum]